MQGNQSTVDPAEVAKFEAMAMEWWDLEGKFKPLHMLNPCRLDYITQQIATEFGCDLKVGLPFKGLRILDIGCGGDYCANPWRGSERQLWAQMRRPEIFQWHKYMHKNLVFRSTTATLLPKV